MTDALAPMRLVTIVAEEVLAPRLVAAVMAAGATGYTTSPASGLGSRGLRSTTLGGENVRVETLVAPAAAERLMAVLARDWFPHYAVVAWVAEVAVVRGEKYGAKLHE